MENANSDEHRMGEIALEREPTVAEMPFSSPRRSGPVEFFKANDRPTKNCQERENEGHRSRKIGGRGSENNHMTGRNPFTEIPGL